MFVKNKFSNKIIKIAIIIVLFFLAIGVWYFPVIFKGYSPVPQGSSYLVRAKNLAISDIYGSENKLNVILSSSLIKDEGHESKAGKKLNGYFYSSLIKKFNINSNEKVIFTNCVILATAFLFFLLAILALFSFKIAIYFGLIYIFLPANISLSLTINYTFPLLFLSLFVLFLALWIKTNKHKPTSVDQGSNKTQWLINLKPSFCLLLSGIFLSLASLANEVFMLILPILFVVLLISKISIKSIIGIFLPAFFILGVFWLPTFLSGQNTYLQLFSKNTMPELENSDLDRYGHLFPDPYTYHFLKDEYLAEKQKDISQSDTMAQIAVKKHLKNFGYLEINVFDKLVIGSSLLLKHMFRFISLAEFGGPLIFLLFILGFLRLKKKITLLYTFYLYWIVGSIILMSYIIFVDRSHIMDFGHIISLCLALGIISLANIVSEKLSKQNIKNIFQIILLASVVYTFVLMAHTKWGGIYNEQTIQNNEYINIIKNYTINNEEVIAVPFSIGFSYNLNFNSDKSITYFRKETIDKLISQNKLEETFKTFNVKYIFGYNTEQTEKITSISKVTAIETNNIQKEKFKASNKSWLMNIIR